MAITVVSVEVNTAGPAGVPVTVAPYDLGSEGTFTIYTLICTSSVSLAGQNLHYNPALWRDPLQTEIPLVNTPLFGFVGSYPTAGYPLTVPMSALPTPRSDQGVNFVAAFTATSATDFSITISFIHTYDLNDFVTDGTAPKQTRLTKNNVLAPEILLNDVLSVYNVNRVLRSAIVTDDLAGTVDGIYHDFEFGARFYEQGLLGGAAEYTNWSYELTRNGEVVTNLSIHDPTTIKFQVDIASIGSISAVNQFMLYREDSPVNGFGFLSDLEAMIYSSGVPLIGPPDVLSFVAWTLVSGTVYELTYEIDAAHFELNGQYRFISVAIEGPDSNGITNSFITPTLIVADADPKATTGTMTGTLEDYNDIFGNCLEATLMERIQSCVSVDKATYNAEIITNATEGTFNSNFDNVRVTVVSLFGDIGTVIDVNTNTGSPDLVVVDNNDTYSTCLTFRLQPEWANTAFVITHTYTYNLSKDGVPYSDVITFIQTINADKLEENDGAPVITGIVFKDIGGNVLTELCDTDAGPITVEVTKGVTPDDYNLIALIRRDIANEAPQEEESYDNNILEQLESDIIDAVDATFVANVAVFEVDPTKLERGQKYRVFAIAKKVNLTPPVPCPVIEIETNTEVTSTGLIGPDEVTTLDIDFTIANLGILTITSVDINSTVSGINVTGPNQNDAFVLPTGLYTYTITFTDGFRGIAANVQLVIDVVLSNGCTYSGRIHNHGIIPTLGSKTQIITDEIGD